MGLLSGFAAVFLLLQMGREWRQCNTRITKDAAEISQHKQQRRRQQATTIATTTTALAAVTMTIRSRTVTISDMTMEKWQATTEMTMTTTNDKKMKKWQKDRQFQPTLMGAQNWQYEKTYGSAKKNKHLKIC